MSVHGYRKAGLVVVLTFRVNRDAGSRPRLSRQGTGKHTSPAAEAVRAEPRVAPDARCCDRAEESVAPERGPVLVTGYGGARGWGGSLPIGWCQD
jgi:hypothetical protein